jgi:hypothetical protein
MKIDIFSPPLVDSIVWGTISKKYLSKVYHIREKLISFLFVFSLLQFVISETHAQNFFPLKVGNAYQIKNFWSWWGPGGNGEIGTDYYAITVVEDSIINGVTFFRYSNNPLLNNGYLFNYDSLNQKIYVKLPNDSTIRLGIDFIAPSGTTYTSYLRGSTLQFTSGGISSEVVLGDTHSVYTMQYYPASDNFIYKFADNIGLSYFRAWGGIIQAGYESTHNVISGIIDSIIYNPIILNIDTLYPIQDRPIDTFPFLLTVSYTANLPQLINSFYLSVEHIRVDTLIQSLQYNISKNNPHITFNLPDLLVGDKIKLRATATDSSIFFNVAQYPDTGWVVMNVLPPILNVENESFPIHYELLQNYPNPFNPSTKIKYQIPELNFVIIKVYDVLGTEITTLVNEEKIAGSYDVDFDGNELASGIYYYRITTGNFSQTKKMILIK